MPEVTRVIHVFSSHYFAPKIIFPIKEFPAGLTLPSESDRPFLLRSTHFFLAYKMITAMFGWTTPKEVTWSNRWHIEIGKEAVCMGMAEVVDWISVLLPAGLRTRPFQPASLFRIQNSSFYQLSGHRALLLPAHGQSPKKHRGSLSEGSCSFCSVLGPPHGQHLVTRRVWTWQGKESDLSS